ncbi:DUF742 domain-containing protein [Saccharopolyspora sp. MS10]|uniref:DUF742 domain-containing protein n=1 Tax=Saccharopolyspora sp. MS10 TaxID=3385973 RepID=UPI0039A3CE3A
MSGPEFGEQDRRRDEPDANTFADVMNGFTFDSGRSRRGRRRKGEQAEEPAAEGEAAAQPPPSRRPTARPPVDPFDQRDPFDSQEFEWETQAPTYRDPEEGWGAPEQPGGWTREAADEATGPQHPWQRPGGGDDPAREQSRGAFAGPGWEPEPPAEVPAAIRSYTWTGGRTRSNYELQMETLVSTSETFRSGSAGRMEHESIAEMCRHPRSVAEVGALLSVPIGVARVLLADMAELGMVTVHQTVTESGSAPHLLLMERVLSGLRRL